MFLVGQDGEGVMDKLEKEALIRMRTQAKSRPEARKMATFGAAFDEVIGKERDLVLAR